MQALTALVIALVSQNFCGMWMVQDVNTEKNFTFRQVKFLDRQRSSCDRSLTILLAIFSPSGQTPGEQMKPGD